MSNKTQIQLDPNPEVLLINVGSGIQGDIVDTLNQTNIKWSAYYRNWTTKLKYSNLIPVLQTQDKAHSVIVFDYNSCCEDMLPQWLNDNFFFIYENIPPPKHPIITIFNNIKDDTHDCNDVIDFFLHTLKIPYPIRIVEQKKREWTKKLEKYIVEAWNECINSSGPNSYEKDKKLRREFVDKARTLQHTEYPLSVNESKLMKELLILYEKSPNNFTLCLDMCSYPYNLSYNESYLLIRDFVNSIIRQHNALPKAVQNLSEDSSSSDILKVCSKELTT